MVKEEKGLPLPLQVRELKLEVNRVRQKVVLLEAIIAFILPLISPSSGKEIEDLREYKKLLRINRGV